MTLVIRTEEACKPPTSMGKRAVLYSSTRNHEKSKYQTHQEKEMWSRLRGSKDPYLVMLFKTSWGDEGDDVIVIQRPRHEQPKVQKPPPKPANPQGLAHSFCFPPQRKARRVDDGKTTECPSEERTKWAEKILRDVKVDRHSASEHTDNVMALVDILKRQGKIKEADDYKEAIVILTAYRTHKEVSHAKRQEKRDILENKKNPILRPLRKVSVPAVNVSASFDDEDTEVTQSEYQHIDFYDMPLYQQKQREEREKKDFKDPAGRRHRKKGDDDCDEQNELLSLPDQSVDKKIKRRRHKQQCRYHKDNIHPSFKAVGHKASFKFPRAGLKSSNDRVTAAHKGSTFIRHLAVTQDVEASFPITTIEEAQRVKSMKCTYSDLLENGEWAGDAKRHDGDSDCSCSTDSGHDEDGSVGNKVTEWRKQWHRTRARLDHDLELALEEREGCKCEVYNSVRHLGHLASSAAEGGKAWARARIRPTSCKGGLKRPQTSEHRSPKKLTQSEQTLSNLKLCSGQLLQIVAILDEHTKEIGTVRDTDTFRANINVNLEEGNKLVQHSKTFISCDTSHMDIIERRRCERAHISIKIAKQKFAKLSEMYEATQLRRQNPDSIVRRPASTQWGRSMWYAAKQELDSENDKLQKSTKFYARLRAHCLSTGFPADAAQQDFLMVVRQFLIDGHEANSCLLSEVVKHITPPAPTRDISKILAYMGTELSVAPDHLDHIMRDLQTSCGSLC